MISFESFFLSGKSPIQCSLSSFNHQEDATEEGELENFSISGWKLELPIRIQCSILAQRAGILLEHSQQTISSTQFIIQKFLCQQAPSTAAILSSSPNEKDIFIWASIDLAMAATLLSSKIDSHGGWRKIRDIINVFYYIWQEIRSIKPKLMEYVNSQYYQWRDRLLRMELLVLKELAFNIEYTPPTLETLKLAKSLLIRNDDLQYILSVSNDCSLTIIPLLIEDLKVFSIVIIDYCIWKRKIILENSINSEWKFLLRDTDPTILGTSSRLLDEFYSFTSSEDNILNLLRSPLSVQELE